MGRSFRWPAALLVTVLTANFLTGCSGVGPRATPATDPPQQAKVRAALADRVLQVGVLLPQSGPGEALAKPLIRALQLSETEINNNGGVFGHPIKLVLADEGTDLTTASASLSRLLSDTPVDAIVGPASSRLALGLRTQLAASQMPTCSPLATAASLTNIDSRGLFFRTIPSDRAQASALALAVDRTGGKTPAIVYPKDAYGVAFRDALLGELSRLRLQPRQPIPYDPTAKEFRDVAAGVFTGNAPDTVAVIGSGDSGARVLAAIRSTSANKTNVIVNDELRSVGSSGQSPATNPTWLDRVQGVAPTSAPSIEWAKRFATETSSPSDGFAAYAYDCLTLIALAASAADDDSPSRLFASAIEVSKGGVRCVGFAECQQQLAAKRNIDLVGASGPLDLKEDGDIAGGTFDVFAFNTTGRDVLTSQTINVG